MSEIEALPGETGELVNLVCEEYGKGVHLCRWSGDAAVDLEILNRHDLPSRAADTITNRDTLYEELEEVRNRGYATEDEEGVSGPRCVPAPILHQETVMESVGVAVPKSRMTGERFQHKIPDAVNNTTNVVELELGTSEIHK